MNLRCFFEQFKGKLIELKNEDGFLDKYENSREWTRFIKKEVLTKILGKPILFHVFRQAISDAPFLVHHLFYTGGKKKRRNEMPIFIRMRYCARA